MKKSNLPALLFYATVSISIHYAIVKNGWGEILDEDHSTFDSRRDFLLQTAQYNVPLLVLVYFLMWKQYPPMLVGLYTIVGFVAVRGVVLLATRRPREFLVDTVRGLRTGAVNLAPYLAILGSLGIVIDIVTYSGLANKIAIWIVLFSEGSFLLVLLLSMVVCLLFGLGMPTPAAYIVVALILAPALVQIGMQTLTAHFYVFYFAVFSALTPPVAVAVAVGSGIADADFLASAKETMKIGAPVYLIPFIFVANPEILYWEFPVTLIKAGVFFVGIVAMVNMMLGFNGRRGMSLSERGVALVLFGAMAFAPSVSIQVGAAVVFVVVTYLTVPILTRVESVGQILR